MSQQPWTTPTLTALGGPHLAAGYKAASSFEHESGAINYGPPS